MTDDVYDRIARIAALDQTSSPVVAQVLLHHTVTFAWRVNELTDARAGSFLELRGGVLDRWAALTIRLHSLALKLGFSRRQIGEALDRQLRAYEDPEASS